MLFQAYSDLLAGLPDDLPHLFGRDLSIKAGLWLSVDGRNYPSLLFPTDGSGEQHDIALRAIDVQFSRKCEILTDDASVAAGTFTIVRLNEDEPEIVRVFLRLIEEAFCVSSSATDNRGIRERVLEIADLFSQLETMHSDVLGLWGELFVISKATNTSAAVRCWCLHKSARHDFVTADYFLEVKTTVRPARVHRFSLEQLRSLGEPDVLIASIQLVEAFAGRAVSALIDEITDVLEDADLSRSFFRLCLLKGGRDIFRDERRFVLAPGKSNPAFYQASDIPAPLIGPDEPISNLRFDVDLSALTQSSAHGAPDLSWDERVSDE